MPTHLKTHTMYTLIFVLLLVLDAVVMYVFSPSKATELFLVSITSLAYVVWGIVHHSLSHDISVKIVIEYFLVSLLGFTVVLFFLKNT